MQPRTVLVVEDDPILRSDIGTLFRDAGLDVVEMDNADEALAWTWEESAKIAAIFTDVQMPGRSDGLHLAQTISRHWPHIFVLVTSGRVAPIDPLPRNVRFIPKPWQGAELLQTIRSAMPT